MRYPDRDLKRYFAPVQHDGGSNPVRHCFNRIVMQRSHTVLQNKPAWVHLPDRVWRRNSALLMSMHERKRFDD